MGSVQSQLEAYSIKDPYAKICVLNKGRMYTDKEVQFPPTAPGWAGISAIQWKRPQMRWNAQRDEDKKPLLVDDKHKVMRIVPGVFRDSWLVTAFIAVGRHNWLLRGAIPSDQTFSPGSYIGAFHFLLWQFGEWQDVIVDDTLPFFNSDQFCLAHFQVNPEDELWPPLIEKAYLKCISGSGPLLWDSLSKGTPGDAMTDLTGGLCELYDLPRLEGKTHASVLFNLLKDAKNMKALLALTAKSDADIASHEIEEIGLVPGHHYTIIGTRTLRVFKDADIIEINLFHVKDPDGIPTNWAGEWYIPTNPNTHSKWDDVSEGVKHQVINTRMSEQGEFYVTQEELIVYFRYISLCHVRTEDKRIIREVLHKSGTFRSPGAIDYRANPTTYASNQQFYLHVKHPGFDYIIAVMQKRHHYQGLFTIGFHLFNLHSESPSGSLGPGYFAHTEVKHVSPGEACDHGLQPWREVVSRFQLDPGHYIIVPCVKEPTGNTDFLIRAYTAKSEYGMGRLYDVINSDLHPELFNCSLADELFDKFKTRVKKEKKTEEFMQPEALQLLLTTFPTDDRPAGFSLEETKFLMRYRDSETEGQLSRKEFELLWTDIWNSWKAAERQLQLDRYLFSEALCSKTLNFGLQTSPNFDTLVTLLYRQFADTDQMSLKHFIVCIQFIISRIRAYSFSVDPNHKISLADFMIDELQATSSHPENVESEFV